MATIEGTVDNAQGASPVVTWQLPEAGDIGESLAGWNQYPDKTVQVTNGTADIEGCNDGENWAILHDIKGVPLSGIGPSLLAVILENPAFMRCVATDEATVVVMTGAK